MTVHLMISVAMSCGKLIRQLVNFWSHV